MQGWISLHRQITNNWVWESKPFSYGQAWIDILLECNHQENKVLIKGKLINIKRGESINSLKTWALRFGWSISKVRHFFDLLQKDGMLRLESERVTTRLIVCNYGSYQDIQHTEGTQKKRRKISERFQKDLNNNDNKENKENNSNNDKDIHPLQKHIKKEFSNVSKIENQLTKENCENLLKDFSKEDINNILEQMENKQDLTKKYTSVNLTLRSWLKRNIKDPEKKILAVN